MVDYDDEEEYDDDEEEYDDDEYYDDDEDEGKHNTSIYNQC